MPIGENLKMYDQTDTQGNKTNTWLFRRLAVSIELDDLESDFGSTVQLMTFNCEIYKWPWCNVATESYQCWKKLEESAKLKLTSTKPKAFPDKRFQSRIICNHSSLTDAYCNFVYSSRNFDSRQENLRKAERNNPILVQLRTERLVKRGGHIG